MKINRIETEKGEKISKYREGRKPGNNRDLKFVMTDL
jgi:hypothetical protein